MAVLAVASVKIATNYLSLEGYGEYAVVYEFLAFFSIAADMGLFTIAVKEMSEDESKVEKIIGNILSLRTILVVTMMAAASIAVFLIPKYEGTRIPLGVTIASFSVLFTLLNGTISSVLQAKLKMHISSMSQIIGKVVMILYMLYVVFIAFPQASDIGFYHLIIAGVVGNLVMVLITDRAVRKITPLNYKFDWDLWKKVLIKAIPYGTALILSTIYFRIDSILISLIKDQSEVGIYAVALRVLEAFQIIPLYFMNSVLPVLTKAMKESLEKAKLIVRYSFDFLTALSIPLLVGAYVLAYPIIFIVSSPEFLSRINEGFYGSDVALKYLMFAMVFQFLGTLFAFILLSVDKQSKILYINLGCVIFKIAANILAIPVFGFRGAAVTSIAAEFLVMAVGAFTAYKYFKFKFNFVTTFKIIISALLMGAAVKFLWPITYDIFQNAGIFILAAIGAIIYGALLLATKAVSKDMLRMLKKADSSSGLN
jgi:O-antigen/teichoic acid export membrane protein